MGIMTRCLRLWKADVHGVIDEFEDQGLTLKQSFREMEEELDRQEAHGRELLARRDEFIQCRDRVAGECTRLEADIEVTLDQNRDDLARPLIKRRKILTRHREELGRHLDALSRRLTEHTELLAEQRCQFEELKLKAIGFHARQEQQGPGPLSPLWADWAREPSSEEVEAELLQRKEAMAEKKGGEGK